MRYGAPARRYDGLHKDYGFAYPGAYVSRDRGSLVVVYSVNKEDIEMLELPLSELHSTQPKPPPS